MTKKDKLRAIENAAFSVAHGVHSFACVALEDIGGRSLRDEFYRIFCPDHVTKWWQYWNFDKENNRERLLALCLFHEMIRTGY